MSTAGLDFLTPREREILKLIAEGNSLSEIAQKLSRSLKTIESHRLSLGRKLRVSNRVELTKIAIANGLVRIDPVADAVNTSSLAERELQWLELINDAIADNYGKQLLERFCVAASRLPNVSIASICIPELGPNGSPRPNKRVTMAIAEDGTLGKMLSYNAEKTPCEDVTLHGQCRYAKGVQAAYPEDHWLKHVQAESYLGVQLLNHHCEPMGSCALIGRQEMDNIEELQKVLDFFAPRLAGALEASIEFNLLRAQIDMLESELAEPDVDAEASSPEQLTSPVRLALAQASSRVHAVAGASFIRSIASVIAELFNLSHVGICKIDQSYVTQTLTSTVFILDGAIADTISYITTDTPCAIVLEKGSYFIANDAGKRFPNDDVLLKNDIQSYLGLRVSTSEGKIVGLIWMGSREPIQSAENILKVARHFAPRIGAELGNLLHIEAIWQDYEALEEELRMLKMKHDE